MTSKKTQLSDVAVKSCEELVREGDLLMYQGEPVARLAINWGWTRWYDNENGGGYGTVRNTGYFSCDEAEFREYATTQGEAE